MGITCFTEEITSTVSAAKLFKANVLKGHELCPKLMPAVVASAAIIEGDGGVGSIRQINFTEGVMPFPFIKERIDGLDAENFECTLTLIEGADIGSKLESAICRIKVVSTGDGGSVYKVSGEYKSLSGVADYTEEELQRVKNGMIGMFKAIEGYLIANPDY